MSPGRGVARIMNGMEEGHKKTLCNDGASSESGYEPLLRTLFHRGFWGDCTLLMILSAPLHPSLIDFGSKYFFLCQKVNFQFHNLLNGWVQNCCQLVVLIELQEYLWNSPREHANSLRRGCRGAGLHRRGARGRGSLVGNSLQGADSNVKVAGFWRRPMATKLVVRIPNWLVVGEPDYQVSKTAKI